MISLFCLIKTFSLFSGPIYQRRSPGGVSTCQPANSSGVYCKWSPYTSCNLEETRCRISRKQPEVKVCRCSETTVIILVIAVQPSHPLWCAHAQVHICRWWVFTHPLCSGDWHRTLPLHGSKSSWNTTQESGPAGLWSVYENFTFKLLNGLQHIMLVTKWPAYIFHLPVPPSITEGRTNVTVTVNVQTTLSCEATGIPKPTVSWKKNGRAINTDQNQNMYRLIQVFSVFVFLFQILNLIYEDQLKENLSNHELISPHCLFFPDNFLLDPWWL